MRHFARSLALTATAVLLMASCSSDSKQCPTLDPTDVPSSQDSQQDDLGTDIPQFDTNPWLDQLPSDMLPGDYFNQCNTFPLAFACPCEGNGDCQSEFCVEGPYGFVCSQECLDECPEGWICRGIQGFGADLVFVCVPSSKKLCYPCQTDLQCGSSGVCASFTDGTYCSYRCSEANPCPQGFVCKPDEEGSDPVCRPESGSCECTGETSGQIRPCTTTNDLGTCFGYETCQAGLGFVDCTAQQASEEICDGIDNDCDGSFDEGLPLSQTCQKEIPGVGTCAGEQICYGAQGWVCTAPEPTDEYCDYKDNDCDGSIDEIFTDESGLKYVDFNHCGACGTSCAFGFPNGKGKCDPNREIPQCIVESCDAGFFQLNEFQCVPLIASLCEPCAADESCLLEGSKCVQLSDGKYCTKPCSNTNNCPPGYSCDDVEGTQQCIPLSGSCSCDGTNLLLSKSCTASWPALPDPGTVLTICYGTQKCTNLGWTDCILPDDTCDGGDNDCNGIIDDGFLVNGKYVTDVHCGKCGNNCTFVSYTNGNAICDASLETPACAMACLNGFVDVNKNTADGCECQIVPGLDLPDGVDQNCDSVDGELLNAIFVAKNGSDSASGTREAPMLSIQAAINKASLTGRRDVYVATGVYSESILLAKGVQVYGGYSSDFLIRNTILYETAILGGPSTAEKPGAVNAISLTTGEPTVFSGFSVFGRNASTPSGSSYGIYVKDCGSVLSVTGNRVVAGHGAPGILGSGGTDGTTGKAGNSGLAAYGLGSYECSSGLTQGGLPGTQTCGGVDVSGGKGGSNACPISGAPAVDESGQDGSGPFLGAGGEAGWDGTLNFDCSLCTLPSDQNPPKPIEGEDGSSGANGGQGLPGAGCTVATGLLAGALWAPVTGGPGGFGNPGSGGGGGGTGGGADRFSFSPTCGDQIGGSGGGGGSGGCPGTSGTGGGGGGGSFAIFVVFSTPPPILPSIVNNTLVGGMGGSGGSGGYGGTGGPGGAGGNGGSGGKTGTGAWCAKSGGGGGDGGDGGHGGGGGGGCGGVSYCLYAFTFGSADLNALKSANNPCTTGAGGMGGDGGPSVGNSGGDGSDGASGVTNL